MHEKVDETDFEILKLLHEDASLSKAEIGRRIGLAASAVFARIRRLEQDGVIRGYTADIDQTALGLGLLVFVFVTEARPAPPGETLASLAELNLAEEIHRISGEDCYLLKLRARDTRDLREKLDAIGRIPTVGGVRTHLSLQSEKYSSLLTPVSQG